MLSRMKLACGAVCSLVACSSLLHAAPPRVLVDGCKLEQMAAEPDIVTPVGCAFDPAGRLLVVESHTHQRPDDYAGPAGDRIRLLSDADGDGTLDRWSTFAEGYQQAMNVAVAEDGAVYVVTRRDVHLLRDADDDGVADSDEVIIRLETEAEYPHNGLSGICLVRGEEFASQGMIYTQSQLYLGLGENFGFPYTLIGSDGKKVSGNGGVGSIFGCFFDGSGVERIADGFWNPFSICLDSGNRMFTVDNDPDASPPCRLLHVIYSGDYGHRWEYGRAGVHPLQAWDGELPGSLPMICGTGEAPTAVVMHRGWLWVTSWGDHRIERYKLTSRGASFGAEREVVVQGDADFRPTGMAVAPDGALWFADWVDRSYPVHGNGRIWRLTLPDDASVHEPPKSSAETFTSWEHIWSVRFTRDAFALTNWASNSLVFMIMEYGVEDGVRRTWESATEIGQKVHLVNLTRWFLVDDDASWFGKANAEPLIREILTSALKDASAGVRLAAVRRIADAKLLEFRDNVAALLDGPIPDERYFLAVIGAIDWLDGDGTPRHSGIGDGLLARELRNKRRSPELHALALRMISPDHKQITLDALREYLASPSLELQREAVSALARKTDPQRFELLSKIAADANRPAELRAIAIAGLAADASQHEDQLTQLAENGNGAIAKEAARVLRLTSLRSPLTEEKPAADDLPGWNELLAAGGDPASGERLFFTPAGANCAVCHQHRGRGGQVGPDLTRIGAQQSRERIISSILQPSREIAPRYQPWVLATDDGLTHLGLRLPQGGDDGRESYADTNGKTFTLNSEEIDERLPSDQSIMPAGLEQVMTIADLRDIVAFLSGDDAATTETEDAP
ncbi:MAG: hypothetical protein CMJ58_14735 [Planctomycetaceae bacterium]|nr:hypothetical protein [Planctomycetaceae bacterium]